MNDIRLDYDQYQRLGELKPTMIQNTTKYTLDEIKDAFYQKSQIEAFDMLCEVIKDMQKRIDELEKK